MIHIAIADDRLPSLEKLVSYLENNAAVSLDIKATNGHDLISKIHLQKKLPDIVFMDINMPFMDGIATTYFLHLYYPSIRVIGLSIYDDAKTIQHIFDSGACGYIIKPNAESVLDTAIKNVEAGQMYIDARAGFSEGEKSNLISKIGVTNNYSHFNLTNRERIFIALNATTLSYQQIAEIMFVETKTIQTYFDRVAKKLHVGTRQALTLFSLQTGLAKLAVFPNSRLSHD